MEAGAALTFHALAHLTTRDVALVLERTRDLRALGEPTDAPTRAPARAPPYWKSRVLRRAAGDEAAA